MTRRETTAPRTFVAFLRGINVGRARQVAMSDLRAIVESLGCDEVRTLLRSGNIVFSAQGTDTRAIATRLEEAIEASLGMVVGVVVRTAEELAAVTAADLLPEAATDGARRHVVFLSERLDPEVRRWLEDEEFGPDVVRAAEREVHVWYERGMSGSETATRLGRRLPRSATDRNWNTVTKLLAMTSVEG
jgi:uncharacterized protein (DUF1697 family)